MLSDPNAGSRLASGSGAGPEHSMLTASIQRQFPCAHPACGQLASRDSSPVHATSSSHIVRAGSLPRKPVFAMPEVCPSWRQATPASTSSKSSSHTPPHSPWWKISSLPWLSEGPSSRRRSPSEGVVLGGAARVLPVPVRDHAPWPMAFSARIWNSYSVSGSSASMIAGGRAMSLVVIQVHAGLGSVRARYR